MIDPALIQTFTTLAVAIISGFVAIRVALIQTSAKSQSNDSRIHLPDGVIIRHRSARPIASVIVFTAVGGIVGYLIGGAFNGAAGPSDSGTKSPTNTMPMTSTVSPPTSTLIPTTTLLPTVTLDPATPQGDCDKVKPPCTYTIGEDDKSYYMIAFKIYGDYSKSLTIINYNRILRGGYFVFLKAGNTLFIPSLDSLPPLPYPECAGLTPENFREGLPCQQTARKGDTFASITYAVFGSLYTPIDYAYLNYVNELIQKDNPIYGLSEAEIINGTIPEGTTIVVSIPPPPAPAP